MTIQIASLTDPEVLVDVPARLSGGYVELATRADTKADADAAAVAAGMMVERTREDGSTYLVEPRTVRRVEVGPVTITEGVEQLVAELPGTVSIYGPFNELMSVTDGETIQGLSRAYRRGQEWSVADGDTVAEGDLLAAAVAPVIDSRHHDNWRIRPTQVHASGRPLWEVTVLSWVANGSPLPQANAAEQGVRYGTVELIDPETISSPSVVVS
jgi:hypothetical protein